MHCKQNLRINTLRIRYLKRISFKIIFTYTRLKFVHSNKPLKYRICISFILHHHEVPGLGAGGIVVILLLVLLVAAGIILIFLARRYPDILPEYLNRFNPWRDNLQDCEGGNALKNFYNE